MDKHVGTIKIWEDRPRGGSSRVPFSAGYHHSPLALPKKDHLEVYHGIPDFQTNPYISHICPDISGVKLPENR